jgi:hypothetical protein
MIMCERVRRHGDVFWLFVLCLVPRSPPRQVMMKSINGARPAPQVTFNEPGLGMWVESVIEVTGPHHVESRSASVRTRRSDYSCTLIAAAIIM